MEILFVPNVGSLNGEMMIKMDEEEWLRYLKDSGLYDMAIKPSLPNKHTELYLESD